MTRAQKKARADRSRANGAKGGRPKGALSAKRHVDDYAAIGDPPDDPLELPGYLVRALAVAAKKVMNDGKMSERQRRQELRALAGVASRLVPRERLRAAERLVRGDVAKTSEDVAGPELEDVVGEDEPLNG